MISDKTIQIVKSTAPILQEHGETLTRHFYKRMFTHNPEVAPYFNQSNQHSGTQQRALAGAICAYAANIDNLEVLGKAVELIAQKHASLMIKPAHYPIVGENLLASIREVLGEGATDEVINAWGEAYQFLADILIAREQEIYAQNASVKGGWVGFRDFTVYKKEKESDVITSFYLKAADGGAVPTYLPGQYITVRVPTPNGSTTMRNYSLSCAPNGEYLRISVKKESSPGYADGYVSNYLHNHIKLNNSLEVGAPCGEFFLNPSDKHQRPLVLLAAGVGVTPLMSILEAVLQHTPKREVYFVHGCLNPQVQAFRKTLDDVASKHKNITVYHRYSEALQSDERLEPNASIGFIDAEFIESILPTTNADYYFCGPKPFMVKVYQDLLHWGIPASQVNFEFFGPREELTAT